MTEISGTVTLHASGVQGATVTIVDLETDAVETQTTGTNGDYQATLTGSDHVVAAHYEVGSDHYNDTVVIASGDTTADFELDPYESPDTQNVVLEEDPSVFVLPATTSASASGNGPEIISADATTVGAPTASAGASATSSTITAGVSVSVQTSPATALAGGTNLIDVGSGPGPAGAYITAIDKDSHEVLEVTRTDLDGNWEMEIQSGREVVVVASYQDGETLYNDDVHITTTDSTITHDFTFTQYEPGGSRDVTLESNVEAVSVSAPTATSSTSVFSPTVTANEAVTISPGSASASASARPPDVITQTATTVGAPTASASATGVSPFIQTDQSVLVSVPITPATASATAPTVTSREVTTVETPLSTATTTTYPATVATGSSTAVSPATATALTETFSPTITTTRSRTLTPPMARATTVTLSPEVHGATPTIREMSFDVSLPGEHTRVDLDIVRGDTIDPVTVTVELGDASESQFEDGNVTWVLARGQHTSEPTRTIDGDIDENTIEFTLDDTDELRAGSYFHQIVYENINGDESTLALGSLRFVTRLLV